MPKQTLEPTAPYGNLHLVARDYLDRLQDLLSEMRKPDDPSLRWQHVHVMAEVNARLAQASELLDRFTTANK